MTLGRLGIVVGLGTALGFGPGLPASAAPKDSLVLGMPVEPPGLDPTVAAPTAIREVVWGNLFEGLVTLDRDGHIQPLLAKSWTVSSDGLTYTFALQPNVTFQNGTPFDAGIVKYSLDRARAPTSTNAQKQLFEPIDRVETPDALTAVVVLNHPVGGFVDDLAWGDAVMVDPKTADGNRVAPVGTGPFAFAEWQRGDHVTLVRNDHYWRPGVPALGRVTFRFIGDPQAQAAALRAGDIDGFPNFSAPELFGDFQHDARFTTAVGMTPRKLVAGLNCALKPLDDVRVRQAMMRAIDRRAVIEAAYAGYGTPIGSHYAPSDPGYIDTTGVLPFDPGKSRALLAEAGLAGGFALTMKVPQMAETARTAEVLQAMLADVGITVTLQPTEFPAAWIDQVFLKHDFAMTAIDHAEPMDIGIYARPSYYFDYRNPALDGVIRTAEGSDDPTRRNALLGEAQKILATDVPALYLFDVPRLGIWRKGLAGLWPNEPLPQTIVTEAHWTE